jgi:hypothetical protein
MTQLSYGVKITKQTREVPVRKLSGPGDGVIETEEIEEFHSGHEVQPGGPKRTFTDGRVAVS